MATLFTGGVGLRRAPAPARPRAAGRRRRGRRGARARARRLERQLDRRDGTRWSTWPAGWCRPGFTDAHVHPIQGGLERTAVRPDRRRARARTTSRWSARTPPASRRPVDHRRRLGDGGVPRRHADARPTSTPSCPDRPVVPAQPRPPRRLGQLAGPSSWPASPPRRPTRRDGRIERDPDGSPQGTLHEGAMELVARLAAAPRPAEYAAGPARGPALPVLARRHRRGRTRSSARTPAWPTPGRRTSTPSRAATCVADVVGALWWDRERGLGADPRPGRAPARRSRRGRFRADERQDHAGRRLRELHRGDARRRTSTGTAHATDNARSLLRRRRGAEGGRGRPRRPRASRCTCTRSATGARARRSTRSRPRARRADGPGDLRHHIAHLQVVHPDDVPRFAALGVAANAQALWACHEPQMDDLTIPFLGDGAGDLAVPVRRPPPRRRPAGDGQRLAGHLARPARRDPHRGRPARRTTTRASRSCPSRRST